MSTISEKILIWGTGAIGGTVGAYLARAGLDITCVDVVADHVEAVRSRGLEISGPVDQFSIRMNAHTPDELTGTWKHVFLAVKAQQTREAAAALVPFVSEGGYVVSLQNGLCEPEIAEVVGKQRVIGAFVNFGADWLGPGQVVYSGRGAVVVGETDGSMTDRLTVLHHTLQIFEPDAICSDRVFSYLWGKLGYTSLLFAQATGEASIVDCLGRPELLPLWRRLAGEVMRVAIAEGIEQEGFNGYDPNAFAPGATAEAARACIAEMVTFNRGSVKTHSGIWRDLAVRKRRTEVDHLIAPVIAIGEKHGLSSPALKQLLVMVHEIEDGMRPMSNANLDELMSRTALPSRI